MEKVIEWLNQFWLEAVDRLPLLSYWQYFVVALVLMIVFKKRIKRFVRRQVRKVTKFIMRIVRLYFIGM